MPASDESSDPLGGVPRPAPVLKIREHLRLAIVSFIALTLLTGCIFPLVLFALGRLVYPAQSVVW
jgi:hypothetical protein